MNKSCLNLGGTELYTNNKNVTYETIANKDDLYFKIGNVDEMPPFFMTIVSDVDFWMFVSSNGGITAGRKNPDSALFPYYTDDKIHDGKETSGSDTCMIVTRGKSKFLWEPFTSHNPNVYKVIRNMYKNTIGNKIVFEEINETLDLIFRYTWQTSNQYGFVKASELLNTSDQSVSVRVLDGIRNILPYGVDTLTQISRSTLVDGYKRSELIKEYGLGIFTLSAIISDKAEPSESLKATSTWSIGLDNPIYLLSEGQRSAFKKDASLYSETDVKGLRGAYYVSSDVNLSAHETKEWYIVSELDQTGTMLEALIHELAEGNELILRLKEDIDRGSKNLKQLVYEADGFQMSSSQRTAYRHFSNALYNIMRGGIYADGYYVDLNDLKAFISTWNRKVYQKNLDLLNTLSEPILYMDLLEKVEAKMDFDLERIIREYLPLTYSRRHGDPSRPWNKFNIDIFDEKGQKNLNFEGNWRDIFQNWEALSLSYPRYLESIITKFVNASTADGYNPYRITKKGVDWEVVDSADPWSNIGYWGDHQVIYLLKLMEMSQKYNPSTLVELLDRKGFVYANVPYRIKRFDEILKDPKDTIFFDDILAEQIEKSVRDLGSDGKLLYQGDEIYHVNLLEKILLVALSKLTNYIPMGGIWMNTQRPEWNDANNALVGNGVSMVTLYYLHRYLKFLKQLLDSRKNDFELSEEVGILFEGVHHVFHQYIGYVGFSINDQERFKMVKALGEIGSSYRQSIYSHGFSGKKVALSIGKLNDFIDVVLVHLRDTIKNNKREDRLYHSYNLIKFEKDSCKISHLYEMLEGQVAVLSSKALNVSEVLEVLEALKKSAIYREDQNSYMLYPERSLSTFLEKNIIPEGKVVTSTLLKNELAQGLTRFVEKSVNGKYRFNGRFRNGSEVYEAIIKTGEYPIEEAKAVSELFSEIFDHHAFTGRSGTFYKYEGLGCIYWHMVSKLVLAIQEVFNDVISDENNWEAADRLAYYYHDVKSGIGVDKSPVEYGAFPTDAYSHTPGFAGVQQPGMTGQVKEDILSRFGELGVSVHDGEVEFNPRLLAKNEFLSSDTEWTLPRQQLLLSKNQIGFTFCAVPIVYELTNHAAITVYYKNGDRYTFENANKLSRDISRSLFNRDGRIEKIMVKLNR